MPTILNPQPDPNNPPVNPPAGDPPPPVDPPQPNPLEEKLTQLQLMIQQQQQQIAQLTQQPPQNQPPQNQSPAEEVNFYTDPQKAIKQQVDASIAPINTFIQSFQRSQLYQSNKMQLKNAFPNLAPYWNVIEPQLDSIFLNGQVEPSPANLMTAVNNVVGQMTLRNPGSFVPQQPQNQNQNQLPPSIPPAPPVNPPVNNAPSNIRLTEQQKLMAKISGLTEEEFVKRLSTPTIIEV